MAAGRVKPNFGPLRCCWWWCNDASCFFSAGCFFCTSNIANKWATLAAKFAVVVVVVVAERNVCCMKMQNYLA